MTHEREELEGSRAQDDQRSEREYERAIALLRRSRGEPAEDFVDHAVLRAVRARAAHVAQPKPLLRRYAKPLLLSALVGAAALAVFALGRSAAWPDTPSVAATPQRSSAPPSDVEDTVLSDSTVPVRFVLPAAGAREVYVAGEFNGWDASLSPLRDEDGDGVFNTTLSLERGAYAYMFVVDGERWVTDPFADAYRDDGFGNRNAIVRIP